MKLLMEQATFLYFKFFLSSSAVTPKALNKIWKHHILDLHHNSSSTDGARSFLAVQPPWVFCPFRYPGSLQSNSWRLSLFIYLFQIIFFDILYFQSCLHGTKKFSCFLNLPIYEIEAERFLLCCVLNLEIILWYFNTNSPIPLDSCFQFTFTWVLII